MGNAETKPYQPELYYDFLLRELASPASSTYFQLLPVDMVNKVYVCLIEEMPHLDRVLSRNFTLVDMHRRPPGALTVDDTRSHWRSEKNDRSALFFPPNIPLSYILDVCFLPRDDEPLCMIDKSFNRSGAQFVVFTRSAIYAHDRSRDTSYCTTQYIPYSDFVKMKLEHKDNYIFIGPHALPFDRAQGPQFFQTLGKFRDALIQKCKSTIPGSEISLTRSEHILHLAYSEHQYAHMYYYPAIPRPALRRLVVASKCCSDNFLVMYDLTQFGGVNGLLVTTTGIYWADGLNHPHGTNSADLDDFADLNTTLSSPTSGSQIEIISASGVLRSYRPSHSGCVVAIFLERLQALLRTLNAKEGKSRRAPREPTPHST